MSNRQMPAFLEALLAFIAHDVNQPLGAVLMTARACRRGLATGSLSADQVGDGLDRIVADVERASEMLARLRAATGRPSAGRVATDINTLLQRTLADLEDELASLAIVPAMDFCANLPPVHADPLQVQYVARTLMARALDAMPGRAESAQSLIVRSRRSVGVDEVLVEVEHAGAVMTTSEVERIFDPFAGTSRGPLSLELAVCRAIIEDHDGRLGAVPTAHGSVFRFTLPTVHER